MLMSASESQSAIVLELAEEFLERYRQGERPSLKEYIDRHPELAAEIKEVFPAMALMENVALADESLVGEATGSVPATGAAPPAQLGDYRILREVGRGGMGIVYEAEQISLGRHVALKVLPRKVLLDAAQKRRFEREARAAAKLHHTNIVPVFGVGEHEGLPYYVMQFIQGLGLDNVLDELKRMQDGGTPTATGGELRLGRKDVSVADVAHSLLTGAYQGPMEGVESPKQGASAFGAGGVSPLSESQGADAPRSGESVSNTAKLSDSFVLSSSSVKLPGSAGVAHGKGKKTSYWQSVARIGVQVADALEYAHKQGIQHRDIKPSNLALGHRRHGLGGRLRPGSCRQRGPSDADRRHRGHAALHAAGGVRGASRQARRHLFAGLDAVRTAGTASRRLRNKDRHRLIKRVTTEEPTRLDKLNRGHPARPGDDRSQGHRPRSGASLSDGGGADGGLAAFPRR